MKLYEVLSDNLVNKKTHGHLKLNYNILSMSLRNYGTNE